MKKFVSGVIVGVLLFASASVFADSTSLIGQKVQGLFAVEKNGAKVADAVVINGTAYAPVRAVADAAGTKLTVEGKKIIMSGTDAASTKENSTSVGKPSETDLQAERTKLAADIEKKKAVITDFKSSQVDIWDTLIAENPNSTTIPKWQGTKKESETMLKQMEAELGEMQARLAAIDAQLAGK